MGEAILRNAFDGRIRVASAGSNPAGFVHPLAIQVLKEIGLDIRAHRSKSMSEFLRENVDTVITVCNEADYACPTFPGQRHRHHWPFDDPARASGTEQQILAAFRRVRDEMRRVFEAYACGRVDQMRSNSNTAT